MACTLIYGFLYSSHIKSDYVVLFIMSEASGGLFRQPQDKQGISQGLNTATL